METITINQWGKINNVQVEDVKNKVKQTILEKKEQELKWFSDNNEGIMSECTHDTDAEFDLRYPEKDSIKLESYLHTCIDLKIALEIPMTTMI
ncbi:hypothetical protein G9A89_016551 [Geosiphon pyriformis]|nr:hypothetical protein G9A89_016551 [Geosiphon pyriformis]